MDDRPRYMISVAADLVVEVPITFADAALGSEVEVPTPEGAVSLKVLRDGEAAQ